MLEGEQGGLLLSTSGGEELGEYKLDALPVFNGMAAAGGTLYLTLADRRLLCLGPAK